jgi:hypothetical protein
LNGIEACMHHDFDVCRKADRWTQQVHVKVIEE